MHTLVLRAPSLVPRLRESLGTRLQGSPIFYTHEIHNNTRKWPLFCVWPHMPNRLLLTWQSTGLCMQVKPRVDLYRALDSVVTVVRLGSKLNWVHMLPQDISTNGYVCDINPLAIEMTSIHVPTVCRDALSSRSTPISRIASSAETVFKTETCLVSFSYLLPRGNIQQVVVHKGLKGVIVVVTGVPYPLVWAEIWEEVDRPPVHCLTGESKKMSVMVVRFTISRWWQTFFFMGTGEVVHGDAADVRQTS